MLRSAEPAAGRRFRNIVGGSAGNLVEWFDWYVYSAFALYFASSFQHGGVAGLLSPPNPAGICQNQTQGNGWPPTLRALLG